MQMFTKTQDIEIWCHINRCRGKTSEKEDLSYKTFFRLQI